MALTRSLVVLLLVALAAPARGQELDPHDPVSWARLAAVWVQAPALHRPGLRRLAWEVASADAGARAAFERGVGRVEGLEGLARRGPAEAPEAPELSGRARVLERTLATLADGAPGASEPPVRSLERLLRALEAASDAPGTTPVGVQVGVGGPPWFEPLLLLALGPRSEEVLLEARDVAADEALARWAAGGEVEAAGAALARLRTNSAPRPLLPPGLALALERAHAAGWRPPTNEEWEGLGLEDRLERLGVALRLGLGGLPCPGGAPPVTSSGRPRRPTVDDQLRGLGWLALPLLVELSSAAIPQAAAAARELLRPYCGAREVPADWWEVWRPRGPGAWWRALAPLDDPGLRFGGDRRGWQGFAPLAQLAVVDLGDGAGGALSAKLAGMEWPARRQLVTAIAAADLPELDGALEAALDSPDQEVVRCAALSLGRRGSPGALARLLPLAVADSGEGSTERTLAALSALLRAGHADAGPLAAHLAREDRLEPRIEPRLVGRLARHRDRRDVRLVLLAIGAEALMGDERPLAEAALAAATLLPPALQDGAPAAALACALAAEVGPDLLATEQTTLRRAALLVGEAAQAPLRAAGYDVRATLARDLVAFAPDAGRDASGPGAWVRPWVEAALRDGVAPIATGLLLSAATCDQELPRALQEQVRALAGRSGVPGLLRLLEAYGAAPGGVAGLELIVLRNDSVLTLDVVRLEARAGGPAAEVELSGSGCDHSQRRHDEAAPADAARALLPEALVELLAARGPEARLHLRVWR